MLTDKIWDRIKDAARERATQGLRLNRKDAERVVRHIIATEDGPLPQDAIDFYTGELIRLAAEDGISA